MLADSISRLLADVHSFEHRRAIIARGADGDDALWSGLAELGVPFAFISESHGGFGGSMVDCATILRELGRVLCVEPVGALLMAPLRLMAALDLETELASTLAEGRRVAVLDGRGLEVEGDALSGTVRSVEGAPLAAEFLVLTADGALRKLSAESIALTVRLFRMVDGRSAGDVTFSSAPSQLLAVDCEGAFLDMRRELAVAEQWFQLGSMLAATESTIEYVKQRRQFGRPLAQFQTVQAAIAEMAVACEEAQACTMLAAMALDASATPDEADRAQVGSRLRMIRLSESVASSAVQLHGGMGVSEELPIASHYRQMIAFRARHGTVQEARRTMARAAIASGRFAFSAILGEAA